jgi:predicted  nucleic acid-binding Zn-ribbon protein
MGNYSQSESSISRGEDSTASKDASQLDSAGQAILKLLHKAAGAAEANSRQALETAQKLSSQLRAAEDRIAALEAELQLYRDRADRAEEWLSKISTEIQHRLINQPEEKRRQVSQRLQAEL